MHDSFCKLHFSVECLKSEVCWGWEGQGGVCVELAFVFLATPLTFLALQRVTAVREAIAIPRWFSAGWYLSIFMVS